LWVDVEHGKENGNDGTDENPHKGETADTSVPSSTLLEDDRVGGKVEVKHAVDDSNVDTEDDDDWLYKVSRLLRMTRWLDSPRREGTSMVGSRTT
jgi:hypothetical protein